MYNQYDLYVVNHYEIDYKIDVDRYYIVHL